MSAGRLACDADTIALNASVPHGLAALVVVKARRAGVDVRALRGMGRQKRFAPLLRDICADAHRLGFSYPQIGRALNRDHTTAMYHARRAGA